MHTEHAGSVAGVLCIYSLLGCETVVDVAVPESSPILVAQGFFTADSAWAVRVQRTIAFTSAQKPSLVNDAIVEVWREGGPPFALAWADSGSYYSAGPRPNAGDLYEIRVSTSQGEVLTGNDVLPALPPLIEHKARFVESDGSEDKGRRVVDVELTLDDPEGASEFYALFLVQLRLTEDKRNNQWQPQPPSLFLFESNDPALGESDLDFLDLDKKQYYEAVFTDEVFDGSIYTIDFSFEYDLPSLGAEFITHRGFAVLLLSVSEHFYEYWKTANRQAFTNENPFSEPLRVHSNLNGGLGIFAGFQFRVIPAAVDTFTLESTCRQSGVEPSLCDSLFTQLESGAITQVLHLQR